MDTIQIYQTFEIPASKGGKATPVDVDGYAVVSNDSLHNLLYGIKDSLSEQGRSLNDLTERVNEISEYGVGFDEVTGTIAIPLLIALFAFAFPFLFTVITHINNKYGSRHISEMFKNSGAYIWFWRATKISIVYLLLFGAVSLLPSVSVHYWIKLISPWSNLLVAAFYSCAIFNFVKTCIAYNNPIDLVDIIDDRHISEMKMCEDEMTATIRRVKYTNYKFWKSSSWRLQVLKGYGWIKDLPLYKMDEVHVDRLIDLCKYALVKKDERLFVEVKHRMNLINKYEKRRGKVNQYLPKKGIKEAEYMFYTNMFIKAMIDFYTSCDKDDRLEERLLTHQLYSLNQSLFPSSVEITVILKTVVSALKQGRSGVYEKYVKYSTYSYNFMMRLPEVAYVTGENEEGQAATFNTLKERWSEMRKAFFIVAASLFSSRHYDVMKALVQKPGYDNGNLYPVTRAELLKSYYVTKKDQYEDGSFRGLKIRELLGDEVDKEMLEKYTVFRMMLSDATDENMLVLLPKNAINEIKDNQKKLKSYVQRIKNDGELTLLYPKLAEADFDKIFKSAIDRLENSYLSDLEREKNCLEKGLDKLTNSKKMTIYDEPLNAEVVDYFKGQMKLFFHQINEIGDGLNGSEVKGKDKTREFGVYTPVISKYSFLDFDDYHFYYIENEYKQSFQDRYKYLLYSAIDEMKKQTVRLTTAEFGDYLTEYTKGRLSEYVIIDTNSHFEAVLDMEMIGPLRYKYMGTDYVRVEWERNRSFQDLPLMQKYDENLVIIKKSDLPVIERAEESVEPWVKVEDVSSEDEGVVRVLVKMNPNLRIRYSSQCEVVVVSHRPMRL